MSRIRLNQEYRNKIANRMRVHLEQEDTIEKQNYDKLKGEQIDLNDNAWKMAEKIVRRHYTDEDVKMAYHLQNNDDTGYGKEWNEKYQLDLIGRNYCRDRSIACTEQEYMFLIDWKKQKAQFVIAHQKWIKSILDQMKEIKVGLKGYKYLDEAIELSTELGLNISDAEIIRTNSTGLTIYNPKNLADRIKGMKNKKVKTKAEKIAERLLYEQQKESVN